MSFYTENSILEIIYVLLEPLKQIDWLIELDNGSEENIEKDDSFCIKISSLTSKGWIVLDSNLDIQNNAKTLFYALGLNEHIDPNAYANIFSQCFYIASLGKFIADGFIKYKK